MMEGNAALREAKMRMLDVVSVLDDPAEIDGLRKVVCDYLSAQLGKEMNRLWDEGVIDDEKNEKFRTLHERTPYNKRTLLNN